jgi:hypothetical protein
MRTTPRDRPRLDLLHPGWAALLGLLVVAWCVARLVPAGEGPALQAVARSSGYLAFLFMLVPYVHIARRCFRHRHGRRMTTWLRWHIGAAYLALFLLLVHCQGRSRGGLTLALLWCFWGVMISGVVGFYGQKLLYRLLPLLVKREYGLELLEAQREELRQRGLALLAEVALPSWQAFAARLSAAGDRLYGLLSGKLLDAEGKEALDRALKALKKGAYSDEDWREEQHDRATLAAALDRALASEAVTELGAGLAPEALGPELRDLLGRDGATLTARQRRRRNLLLLAALCPDTVTAVPGVVEQFCEARARPRLERAFTFGRWLLTAGRDDRVAHNEFTAAFEVADPRQGAVLKRLWDLVEERRQLDLEYRLHQLGRLWLLFHGPLAAALLLLTLEHVVMSLRYGGF